MAQLNPNFEIDFTDINSYEQIQLINDTQLAKENLLMHRAYKEPSDDEIIKNHFSSFTFVDFCPKLHAGRALDGNHQDRSIKTQNSSSQLGPKCQSSSKNLARSNLRDTELETFSDLFERINNWLKLNKDWRVVSVETLVYDFKSQFKHLKSSVHSCSLPQSTRGLRLFLSPSKSRFSEPQKIGCINVVPRKISGSHVQMDGEDEQPVVYEDLDQMLRRLNELLLTRPIEGRILSVETITLPIVDGYVNTECNYFMDNRLNMLFNRTYNLASSTTSTSNEGSLSRAEIGPNGHKLIDILRVYYEFGPAMSGLVNLLDFVPRFYAPMRAQNQHPVGEARPNVADKIPSTESSTRLIRRALTWFEAERKQVLDETAQLGLNRRAKAINLKVCNVQIRHKTLLKSQLLCLNSDNAIDEIQTRLMAHEPAERRPAIECAHCLTSTASLPPQDWCSHLIELSQPYQLKFVRLAYVVPISSKHIRTVRLLRAPRCQNNRLQELASKIDISRNKVSEEPASNGTIDEEPSMQNWSSLSAASFSGSSEGSSQQLSEQQSQADLSSQADQDESSEKEEAEALRQNLLSVLQRTIERHRLHEEAHQTHQADDHIYQVPIGQLTYRLFAPCQLVKSSSCFSINPVNSSSPLARRGSVNINGSGLTNFERASQSSLLLSPIQNQSCSMQSQLASFNHSEVMQQMASFGAFLPAMPHETVYSDVLANNKQQAKEQVGTSNEFEPVDAIRRRMEVYVTTNSMKVIAGETLVVNLSDALSCLSTAIEQTVVRASFAGASQPSTWVSVYILYAAVDEPLLPTHLLAQQRLRDLNFSPEPSRSPEVWLDEQTIDSIFDDDFNDQGQTATSASPSLSGSQRQASRRRSRFGTMPDTPLNGSRPAKLDQNRHQQNAPSTSSFYNSAYDRTVALPTQPDNDSSGLELFDLAGLQQADCLWPF